jgi:hypothetical protein
MNPKGLTIEMIELGQTPTGPPFEHRMELFNAITRAMRDAEGQLEKDGLSQDLINQIISNTLCHALAYMAACEAHKLVALEQANAGAPGARFDA